METRYKQSVTKTKGPHQAEVLSNKKLADDMLMMVLKNSTVAHTARAGQFVSVLCEDLIIRRPLSIAGVEEDTFRLVYRIKGRGTNYLASMKSGEFVDLLGPLGNGFNVENKNSLLVGCGVGVAPMLFLSDTMRVMGIKHTLLVCSQTALKIENIEHIENTPNMLRITEDGSDGLKGRLDEHLEKILEDCKPHKIYTCGPNGAMAYISKIAQNRQNTGIPVEAALEREFACGTGVCMGCVIKVKEGEEVINRRICKDGPVFNAQEVVWQTA